MSTNPESFKISLGNKVEALRSAKKFALLADIEHHQLINIEKGRVDIRLSTLVKIAKGLGIEPKELLDFKI